MRNTAVIYGTKHGTTKRYAEWISEEIGADLFSYEDIAAKKIGSYKNIIFGGGLYAGGILGVKKVKKNLPENLIVFTVGLADPNENDYSPILNKNFTSEQLERIKVFHLRGGIDYSELSFLHRVMMSFVKKSVVKTPEEKRTSEDVALLETYGQKVCFVDRETIQPIIDYYRNHMGE